MAGLSVCFVFILILATSYYRIFLFDDLARYSSKNTEIYLHLDNRGASDNFYKIKVTDAILKSFHINDLDRHLIGSELAIICDNYSGDLVCGLIIQARKTDELEKYLADKRIIFRSMDKNTIIIGADASWLKVIKKSYNPFRYLESQSAYGKFGALTLVINQPTILTSEISKVIKLSGLDNSSKFNGAISNSGLIFKPASLSNIFSPASVRSLIPASCDIEINSSKGSLCANRSGLSGDLLEDFDFTLSSPQLSKENTIKFEKFFLNLASYSQPAQKVYYLNDGTKIIELRPNAANAFSGASSTKTIRLKQKTLYYTNSESGLTISNIIGLKGPSSKDIGGYLSVRINALPKGQIKDILSEFSYLTANDNQIILR
ncbi:MAG: hypothetical protein WCT26_05155 [Candidatus Buchananbacteria bacterium]